MYRFAFEKYDYPKASAVAVIICIILAVLTLAYNKLNKKKDF
jgi:multiple sugar transport system permease protein